MFALGVASLVLGPVYPLSRYSDVVSITTATCFSVAAAAAFRTSGVQAWRSLVAFLTAALACYLAVAAGRAALFVAAAHEGAVQAVVAATRYHYLAQTCLSVVVCLVLAEAERRLPLAQRTKWLLLGGWTAWAAFSGIVLRPPVEHFGAERASVAAVEDRIVQQVRRRPPGSTVCLPVEPAPLAFRFPGSLGVFMLLSDSDVMEGRRVVFTSSDPTLLARRQMAGRTRQLLVPDGECPSR